MTAHRRVQHKLSRSVAHPRLTGSGRLWYPRTILCLHDTQRLSGNVSSRRSAKFPSGNLLPNRDHERVVIACRLTLGCAQRFSFWRSHLACIHLETDKRLMWDYAKPLQQCIAIETRDSRLKVEKKLRNVLS